MQSDSVLLEKYSKMGDAEAFAELARRYAQLVYSTCLRITANPQEAEDITQECFLELARNAGTVRSCLPGWLHKVAKNRALNTISKNATRRQYERAAAGMSDNRSEHGWADIVPIVDEALDKLPEKLREPIILHYFQGLTQAETAVALGIDQSTVSRYLHKAVDSLRKELKKSGVVVIVGVLAALLTDNATASVPVTTMTALGKIAVSGIGTGVSSGTTTGVAVSSLAAIKALLSTGLGKAAIALSILAVSLVVGYTLFRANRISGPAPCEFASTSSEIAKRDSSALQVYLLLDIVSQDNPKGTWRVSLPNQTGDGYIFERVEYSANNEAKVVEVLNSAKQPTEVMNEIVHPERNSPVFTTNDLLPNAEAQIRKDGKPTLTIELTENGTQMFSDFTSKHISEYVAVFANGRLMSAPVVKVAVRISRLEVTGFSSLAEAEAVAKQIKGNTVQP